MYKINEHEIEPQKPLRLKKNAKPLCGVCKDGKILVHFLENLDNSIEERNFYVACNNHNIGNEIVEFEHVLSIPTCTLPNTSTIFHIFERSKI